LIRKDLRRFVSPFLLAGTQMGTQAETGGQKLDWTPSKPPSQLACGFNTLPVAADPRTGRPPGGASSPYVAWRLVAG